MLGYTKVENMNYRGKMYLAALGIILGNVDI